MILQDNQLRNFIKQYTLTIHKPTLDCAMSPTFRKSDQRRVKDGTCQRRADYLKNRTMIKLVHHKIFDPVQSS